MNTGGANRCVSGWDGMGFETDREREGDKRKGIVREGEKARGGKGGGSVVL